MAEAPFGQPPDDVAQPATARAAATVILLRRGGRHTQRGLEVLLVRRSLEARFMPGVWVFPGGAVQADDGAATDEVAHRRCAIRELAEEARIALDDEAELHPWSRWITPEVVPVRFDTRFYVALAPAHSPPRPDGRETIEAGWFGPADALARGRAGELDLVFPTIRHLESLLAYRRSEDVIAAAADRDVEPILPRVVGEGDARRVLLPGDTGY